MTTLLIDMDGVLTKDKEFNPFPYAPTFIRNLKERGVPFRVVSNNSTRSPKAIVDLLKGKGFDLDYSDLITPVAVLPNYLRERGVRKVFVIGTPMLGGFLRESGFEVREDHEVDAVIIGQDKEIDFIKIKTATSAVFLRGARIVPVNLSRIVRDSDGLYFPGAGSTARMIAHATGYTDDIPNLGKPSREFIDMALKGLPRDRVILVSDDIYTDLMGAREIGLETAFMTTGKYREEELKRAGFTPDHVFHSLEELENKIFTWSKD
ncbi:MAG: HAD-IIA family hydrolase [Aquificota bacterium]|nr:HAD-IIA family hydrolase [Aquificota bacterium]